MTALNKNVRQTFSLYVCEVTFPKMFFNKTDQKKNMFVFQFGFYSENKIHKSGVS